MRLYYSIDVMDEFDEHYLYQTALYCDLTDITFASMGIQSSSRELTGISMTRHQWS